MYQALVYKTFKKKEIQIKNLHGNVQWTAVGNTGCLNFNIISSLFRHYHQGMVVHSDFCVAMVWLWLLLHLVVVSDPTDIGVPKLGPCNCGRRNLLLARKKACNWTIEDEDPQPNKAGMKT